MNEEAIAATIRSWHIRARAYQEVAKRYPMFDRFSSRLVAELPEDLTGTALDLGGGAGLTTAILLERFPGLKVVLAEPAEEMRTLAAAALAGHREQVEIADFTANNVPERGFDAAVSSLVMHLVEEDEALPVIGRSLRKGARFAFNLWAHSWAGTDEPPNASAIWAPALDQALTDLKLGKRPTPSPDAAKPAPQLRQRNREGMEKAAAAGGMKVVSVTLDEDQVAASFHLDFAAMSPRFMPRLKGAARASVLIRARDLAQEQLPVKSARIVLEKA